MRTLLALASLLLLISMQPSNASVNDCAGVVRIFGETGSWMSACFTAGDGSWVVTSADTVREAIGPESFLDAKSVIFISYFSGRAAEGKVAAINKDLNLALIKLSYSGLPGAPLAESEVFAKAAFGTVGELMQGEPIGRSWPATFAGVTREKDKDGNFKMAVGGWTAGKVFVTDVEKYRWLFFSDFKPDASLPNGSMAIRDGKVIGMYVDKLVFTGGEKDVVFGRCSMSTEIAKYLSQQGADKDTLINPPTATIKREKDSDALFQLQVRMYSLMGNGRADAAVDIAKEIVKMRPEDAQAKLALGIAFMASGKYDEALAEFDAAQKLEPALSGVAMNKAAAKLALKLPDEAEALLLQAAKDSPTDPRPAAALADFYRGREHSDTKAREWATKAANMLQNSPAAFIKLGAIERERKDYSASIAAITDALKINPNLAAGWFELGIAYEAAGDKQNAEKAYRKMLEKSSNSIEATLTLASFLIDEKRIDEAMQLLKDAKTKNPSKELTEAIEKLEQKAGGKEPDDKQ